MASSSSSSLPGRARQPMARPFGGASTPMGPPSEAQLMPPPRVPQKSFRSDPAPAPNTASIGAGPTSLLDLGGCGDVSLLHCATQNMVLRLHDAIWCLADRPTGEGAQNRDAITTTGYAHDLIQAGRQFESLVEGLPEAIRRPPPQQEQERELNELLEAQQSADKELEALQKKLQTLQDEVGRQLRNVCEDITQGCVNVTTTDSASAAASASAPASSSSSTAAAAAAAAGVAGAAAAPSPSPLLTPLPSPSPWGEQTQAGLIDLNARRARLKAKAQEKRPHPELENAFPDQGRRFLEELEFLEMLANPDYVHWLAQQPYFNEASFVGFLRYLMYWRTTPFVRWVEYPQALRMLEMLCDDRVRAQLHRAEARTLLFKSLMRTWAFTPEEPVKKGFDSGPSGGWTRLPDPPMDLRKAMEAVLKGPPPAESGSGSLDIRQDWGELGKESLIQWAETKRNDPKKMTLLGFKDPEREERTLSLTEVIRTTRREPQADRALQALADEKLQRMLGASSANPTPSRAREAAPGHSSGKRSPPDGGQAAGLQKRR